MQTERSPSVDLDQVQRVGSDSTALCALDDALESLTRIDPRRAKVIELRFFGGLSVDETADVLDVSPQTVMRDWRLARAWLTRELHQSSFFSCLTNSGPERLDTDQANGFSSALGP